MAREPSPIHGVLAFFYPPRGCASAVVEATRPFRWIAQVGDDEALSWKQFSIMPFHSRLPCTGLSGAIDIKDDMPVDCIDHSAFHPFAIQSFRSRPLRFSFCVSNSVSNLPTSLVLAACLSEPFHPTTALMNGS